MAKKTKAEEEYADLVIQSLVQEDYSVSKPVESAATSNESQDMEDKGDAQEAINAYKKLTAKDKVDVVLGAVTSGPSNAIAVISNTDKVPMITPTGTSQDITLSKPYIYRTTYTDPFQGGVMGRYAAKKG